MSVYVCMCVCVCVYNTYMFSYSGQENRLLYIYLPGNSKQVRTNPNSSAL